MKTLKISFEEDAFPAIKEGGVSREMLISSMRDFHDRLFSLFVEFDKNYPKASNSKDRVHQTKRCKLFEARRKAFVFLLDSFYEELEFLKTSP